MRREEEKKKNVKFLNRQTDGIDRKEKEEEEEKKNGKRRGIKYIVITTGDDFARKKEWIELY